MNDEYGRPKVPLNVGWLSEEGLLEEAAGFLRYRVLTGTADGSGVVADILDEGGFLVDSFKLLWSDHLNFDCAQLLKLGFAGGSFDHCEHCGKILVECHQERQDIDRHNDEG